MRRVTHNFCGFLRVTSYSKVPTHLLLTPLCARIAASMEQISEFLGKALRRMDRPEAAMAWLSSAWPTIVGKTLAEHARPLRCQSGCLELTADGKPWQRQLEGMKGEISARVNQAWGGKLVSELKFASDSESVGSRNPSPGPTQASLEADNEHTPFIRRRRA